MVENEDQAKGYPVAKDSYLLVDDDELDKIQIESTHTIDIEKFVPRAEIDPRYYDAPYYIAPSERVAEEAFAIIRDAMRDEKVVGLGRVVIARRERIMMLEPLGKGILGTALRYGSEVRSEDAYFEDIPDLKLPQEMNDLAHVIIERKAGHFRPEEFTDRYEDAVVELIRAKQAGMPAKVTEQPSRPSNVVSIMDALRKSIAVETAKAPVVKPKAETAPAEEVPPPPNRRPRRRPKARLRPPLRQRLRRRRGRPSEVKPARRRRRARHDVAPLGMFPVLGEHVGTERNDLEPVGAGVADHVLDEGHRRARSRACSPAPRCGRR